MSRRTTFTTLVVAVATAAVFTSSAAGMVRADNGAYGTVQELEWVSNGYGGVKAVPVDKASEIPYLSQGVGITREAPALQAEPIFRDVPDGAGLTRGEPVSVSLAESSSVDWSEVAMGFGFGLVLAMLGALSLLMLRNRTLRTQ
jgi:hypothetical protein